MFEDDVKSWDYCPVTGKYKGATHRDANSNLNYKIPIVFCNLKNYDAHHFVKDYHNSYLHYDILLLADIFEKNYLKIMVCVLVIIRTSFKLR